MWYTVYSDTLELVVVGLEDNEARGRMKEKSCKALFGIGSLLANH